MPPFNKKSTTADREFKGGEWLKWLKTQGIHWRIRIANNTKSEKTRFSCEKKLS
ncbi:transposase [Marinibactrum halimedae]|uniref:transposase n=1 Tax=Marinibactrum halimedae TaxID=1444977 RepID=UPI0039F732B6